MSTAPITEAQAAQAALVGQLRASGRAGPAVSAAFLAVPRHVFLPPAEAVQAYQDMAIVTKFDGRGMPVSSSTQPTMMAIMLEQLDLAAGQRVLEIGTGTGYNAAVMATITGDAGTVVTIDIEPDVADQARSSLAAAGFGGVTVIRGDGADGVPGLAPYDRIMVTAGAWDLAPPWLAQLAPGGRIVLPLSVRGIQLSAAFGRDGDHWVSRSACRCGFIRMTGASAGPELILPLGPGPGLHALVTDGPAPAAGALYQALAGPETRVPAGLRADSIAQLADLDLWLTLTEPGLTRLNLISRPKGNPGQALPGIAGLMPLGGLARDAGSGSLGAATVSLPGETAEAARPEVIITGYGADGPALAARLAQRAAVWDSRGRPGADTLALRAYPGRTRPPGDEGGDGDEGGLVIERPHDVLVAGWPAA